MERIKDYNQALILIKDHNLIAKSYGSKAIIYSMCNDKILVINNNFNSYITIEEFKNHFDNSIFYYLKPLEDENEINQEHINYRQ